MKKLKSSLFNMAVVLTLVTALSGLLLGYVYKITAEPRQQASIDKLNNALASVLGSFDNTPGDEAVDVTLSDGTVLRVYPGRIGGELTGVAVESTATGFQDEIAVVFGFDADGNILGYEVTRHSETPGLGSKMDKWFSGEGGRSVIGRNASQAPFIVSKDGGDVDAITAATISSRAFLNALDRAVEARNAYLSVGS